MRLADVFVREVVRCGARDTYRFVRDSIRQGIPAERSTPTASAPLISQRELRDAESECAAADEAWRKHGYQRVPADRLRVRVTLKLRWSAMVPV